MAYGIPGYLPAVINIGIPPSEPVSIGQSKKSGGQFFSIDQSKSTTIHSELFPSLDKLSTKSTCLGR